MNKAHHTQNFPCVMFFSWQVLRLASQYKHLHHCATSSRTGYEDRRASPNTRKEKKSIRFTCTTVNQFGSVHEKFRNCAGFSGAGTAQHSKRMPTCRRSASIMFCPTNVHGVRKFWRSCTAGMTGFRGVNTPTLS